MRKLQAMNSFLYMLQGKAAVGPGKGEKEQIDAHNTITLTKVCYSYFTGPITIHVNVKSLSYIARVHKLASNNVNPHLSDASNP